MVRVARRRSNSNLHKHLTKGGKIRLFFKEGQKKMKMTSNDRKVFRRTASTTKKINIKRPNMIGGNRF